MVLGSSVWCSKLYLLCMEGGTCTCRRHMYMQGQRRVLCPLDQDQGRLYLMGWNEFTRKSTLGRAGIIMVYHITLTILNLTLYPLIQLEKLSFLLAMAMRFVIIK